MVQLEYEEKVEQETETTLLDETCSSTSRKPKLIDSSLTVSGNFVNMKK